MKNTVFGIILSLLLFLWPSTDTLAQPMQLWDIDVQFCNDQIISNELDITSTAWEELSICVNINNTSDQDTTINIDFLDATITQDEHQNRACNAADRPKTTFGNFMLDYTNPIQIPANSNIQKIYKIRFPVWFQWLSHGCLAYNVIQDDPQADNSMLNIIIRKVKFIDVFVWDAQIKSQIKIWSITTIKSWNLSNFQIQLKNIWNVDQQVIFTWTISNIFGFSKNLKLQKNTWDIAPNQEIQIQTDNQDLILPFYKWFFKVSFDILNKPNFDFNIKSDQVDIQNVILGWKFQTSKIIFLFNITFFIVLLVFLVLIYFAIYRNRQIIISKKPIKTKNIKSKSK